MNLPISKHILGRAQPVYPSFRVFASGRTLLPDGSLSARRVVVEDGIIVAIEPIGPKEAAGASDTLLLPGIVDIHGDAFERQIMPRPRARFPIALAIEATDRDLAANGITTAFHGISCSWEGGLRGRDTARALIDEIRSGRSRAVDHRVHLRFEVHSIDIVEEACAWIDAGDVDLLAYNDHLPAMLEDAVNPDRLARFAARSELSADEYLKRLEATAERGSEVPVSKLRLATSAARRGIRSISHDDATEADCEASRALGCSAVEFPLQKRTAAHARRLRMQTIFGAPNVVRGGSHLGNASAAEMARDGLCDVLASDYYYPALIVAPFNLAAAGVLPFASAWRLISANPARTAGLHDRGEIRVGQRADLIVVDDTRLPRVREVFVAGETRFRLR